VLIGAEGGFEEVSDIFETTGLTWSVILSGDLEKNIKTKATASTTIMNADIMYFFCEIYDAELFCLFIEGKGIFFSHTGHM
jgi:hypothetical protein